MFQTVFEVLGYTVTAVAVIALAVSIVKGPGIVLRIGHRIFHH